MPSFWATSTVVSMWCSLCLEECVTSIRHNGRHRGARHCDRLLRLGTPEPPHNRLPWCTEFLRCIDVDRCTAAGGVDHPAVVGTSGRLQGVSGAGHGASPAGGGVCLITVLLYVMTNSMLRGGVQILSLPRAVRLPRSHSLPRQLRISRIPLTFCGLILQGLRVFASFYRPFGSHFHPKRRLFSVCWRHFGHFSRI